MDKGKTNKDRDGRDDDFMMAYFVDDMRPKQDVKNVSSTSNTLLKDNFRIFKMIENQKIYI